jgi:hypothetical protein
MFVQAHVEARQRTGQTLADRLDEGLLARPRAEERGAPIRGRHRGERALLRGRQHVLAERVDIDARPVNLDIDADLANARDGDQRTPGGM